MEYDWGGGGKESSSAHHNPYSLVPLENKANLTAREVSSSRSELSLWLCWLQLYHRDCVELHVPGSSPNLTTNCYHISTCHRVSLFRLLQSSLRNSLSLLSCSLDRP